MQLRDCRAGCGALPGERVHAAAECRHGGKNHHQRHPEPRRPRAARDVAGNRDGETRFGPGCRRHRLGQVDLAGRDDRSSKPLISGAHRHGGRSGRVRTPVTAIAHHPSRSRHRHAFLAQRAQEHAATGAGCDSDRGDPRHGDHGACDRLCRDGTPLPRHPALEQRQSDDRPDHQFLFRGSTQAIAHGPVQQSARDHLAASDPDRGRQGAARGGGDTHQYTHHCGQAAQG